MTKKELEKLVRKLIEDKVPNDQFKILDNLKNIVMTKYEEFMSKYRFCSKCGKYSSKRRWYGNECPLCHRVNLG